jgi:hypothetical protein
MKNHEKFVLKAVFVFHFPWTISFANLVLIYKMKQKIGESCEYEISVLLRTCCIACERVFNPYAGAKASQKSLHLSWISL